MGSAKPGDLDVGVAGIDADSAFGVTFKHDDTLEDAQEACVQCALLYTTAFGERRIRVLTLGFKVTSSVASLFRYADLDALTLIYSCYSPRRHLYRHCVEGATGNAKG